MQLRWHLVGFHTGIGVVGPRDDELKASLLIEANAELFPVWDFCRRCNSLGLPYTLDYVPEDLALRTDWLYRPNAPLLADEFFFFPDLQRTLALAQHHGLPTRLLDWTYDPIAAAFFATEGTLPNPTADLAVWALHELRATTISHPGATFPDGIPGMGAVTPKIAFVRPPVGQNVYMGAQSGLFTSMSASGIYFLQHDGERPSLDRFVSLARPTDVVLRKLILPRDHIVDLAELLRREGVSRAKLMPTLDNVRVDVVRSWTELP